MLILIGVGHYGTISCPGEGMIGSVAFSGRKECNQPSIGASWTSNRKFHELYAELACYSTQLHRMTLFILLSCACLYGIQGIPRTSRPVGGHISNHAVLMARKNLKVQIVTFPTKPMSLLKPL